jgi:hypothetical protein
LAERKATLPGRKQVWRQNDFDVLGLIDERIDGRSLLTSAKAEPLHVIRERCRDAIAALPDRVRQLASADPPYDVRISPGLGTLVDRLTVEHRR